MRSATVPERLPIVLAMTGASGACYGLRLLEHLLSIKWPVQLLLSEAAKQVIPLETELTLPDQAIDIASYLSDHYKTMAPLAVYDQRDWFAPPASGSARAHAMVICPCSMGTLAAIANGNSDHLLERAADVALKERRPLIAVVREAPFSIIHLENMLRLARAGAIILPASPGFYHRPTHITELVDFIVGRILDQLQIPQMLLPRWGDTHAAS